MMHSALMLSLLVVSATAYSMKAGVTPTQKVVQMLEDMSAKAKAEKEDEADRFVAFQKFCQGAAAAKVRSIEENTAVVGKLENEIGDLNDEVDKLAADIAQADADIGTLQSNIAALDNKMKNIESEEGEISEERSAEHAIFEKSDTDYSDSIDAMSRAIHQTKNALLQQDPSARNAALLQIAAQPHLPAKAKKTITSFVQIPTGEANSYDGQLGAITQMFEDLEGKMSEERESGQNEESNHKHAFDMQMLALNDQLKTSNRERDTKAANKAQAEQDLAKANGDKAATEQTMAEDQEYLKQLKAECAAKTAAFEERQETRAGELEAIGKAVEILSGGAVAGGAQHLPSLIQKKGRSLAQLRMSKDSARQRRVVSFLQDQAKVMKSQMLSLIAVKAAQDPFAKVVNMIKDMITKLTNEANEEAEHKGFCDQELSANKATRDEKTQTIDSLNAQIEELNANINQLSSEVAELTDGVNALNQASTDATNLRGTEKAKNEATVVDAKAAIEAVSQATSVLKDFYTKAAEFMQTRAKGVTDGMMDDADYKGNQNQSSGVMSMLEVILSDFQRLEAETTTNEQTAAEDYSTFTADTTANKDAKEADIKRKNTSKVQAQTNLDAANEDLANTQAELTAAVAYFDKLKPSCLDSGLSYEERVARREAEIKSLHEAFGILDGTDVAV